MRCLKLFEGVHISPSNIVHSIYSYICAALEKVIFHQLPSQQHHHEISDHGFNFRFSQTTVKLVRWIPPIQGLVLNVDGACKGNPGFCGGGGCVRDSGGNFILGFAHFYGHGDSLVAETHAICDGVRLDKEHGISIGAIYTDSAILANSI